PGSPGGPLESKPAWMNTLKGVRPRRLFCFPFKRLRMKDPQERSGPMNVISWIVLGLVAGFLCSTLVNKRGEGMFVDIFLGIIGALVGGWLFSLMGIAGAGVSGFNLWSLFVAVFGAVVSLVLWHALRGSGARA